MLPVYSLWLHLYSLHSTPTSVDSCSGGLAVVRPPVGVQPNTPHSVITKDNNTSTSWVLMYNILVELALDTHMEEAEIFGLGISHYQYSISFDLQNLS